MVCALSELMLVLIQARERRGRSSGRPYWREIFTKPPRSAVKGIHAEGAAGMSSIAGSLPTASSDIEESCQSRKKCGSLAVGSDSGSGDRPSVESGVTEKLAK